MKLILIDANMRFRSDLQTRLLVDDERDVELISELNSSNGLMDIINRLHPDAIAVADNVVNEQQDWSTFGLPVYGYAMSDCSEVFIQKKIVHFAKINSAGDFLDLLEKGFPSIAQTPQPAAPSTGPAPTNTTAATAPEVTPSPTPTRFCVGCGSPLMESQRFCPSCGTPVQAVTPAETPAPMPSPFETDSPTPPQSESLIGTGSINDGIPVSPGSPPIPAPPVIEPTFSQEPPAFESDYPGTPQADQVKSQFDQARMARQQSNTASALMRDFEAAAVKKKTTVVTVYSAKGGVGKTTISTELAVYLSLTSSGRSNLRVCLIDYNIDFGDVLTTLDLKADGNNLTFWATEIRERIKNGEKPEDISYSRAEVESFLQVYEDSGLFVLPAPITHEDSFFVESEELKIILDNIVKNGEFDFVVCDTGNNTRDSSMSVLEAADVILLVSTQDVSTVSCNAAFLSTMDKIGFDTNKIKLVINSILPYKQTHVSVGDVEKALSYPCVARIQKNNDVVRANNTSTPLVFQPSHEFTKELQNVVRFLVGGETNVVEEKRGFLSFFHRKNS